MEPESNKVEVSDTQSAPGRLVLSDAERHRLLIEWNNTVREYPRNKCIHQLFEEQVERTPEAMALVFQNQQLTYRELNQRANCLAHRLRGLGVAPEVLVGICVERSPEMVVGLLGILKAGGAYVPLDSEYPQERMNFVVRDCGASVLISQASVCKRVSSSGIEVVCIDDGASNPEIWKKENPVRLTHSRDLAYVIYTSGSTGRPKGVAIEHRSVVALVSWAKSVFSAEDLAGVLASTSLCFDLSIFEIFVPLLLGGTVVIAQNALAVSASSFWEITLINTVPSAMRALLRAKRVPDSVRVVNLAGELLPTTLVDQIYSETKAQKVHDLYGPSETTTYSTFALRQPSTPATIGRPLSNETVYILDEALEPVTIGLIGELHIGGDGLARGYLHRPELTAEKFIPDPFSKEPGARLYKTGDLCRYRSDGNIEFIGRKDHQVKIRGFRIELGEIESVLGNHPGIEAAVAIAWEDGIGEKALAAYLLAKGDSRPAVSELTEFLRRKLPDYMVPSAFMFLAAFPLTPNGKIDRKALPEPDFGRLDEDREFAEPRNSVEKKLAEIWCEILRVKRVSVHDSFFDLGGHSLNAMRIASRASAAFEIEVQARSVVESLTVAKLGAIVEAAVNRKQEKATRRHDAIGERQIQPTQPCMHPVNEPRIAPASANQAQLWFIQQLNPSGTVYNLAFKIRMNGALQLDPLQKALNEVVRRHEPLRTTFESQNGEPVQLISPPAENQVLKLDLVELPEDRAENEADRLASEEITTPFDLQKGPLIRVKLVRLDSATHVLLFGVHHIVFDGLSLEVLLRDLADAYKEACIGGEARLSQLEFQYADFAVWQRDHLSPEVVQEHVSYWKLQLAGVPTILDLAGFQRSEVSSAKTKAEQRVRLSKEIVTSLRQLGARNDCSLFVTVLAAFQALISRHCDQRCFLVGTPFAGRSNGQQGELIGFFVNTLPVKADFSDDPSFAGLLLQTRLHVLEAQAHQELPFEQLVKEFQPVRDRQRNPLFQVALVFENEISTAVEFPGLTVAVEEVPLAEPMFDLVLSLREVAGELEGSFIYDSNLYGQSAVSDLADHLHQLIKSMIADPARPVSTLAILTESERHKLLFEWNNTAQEYPRDKCIHQLFEEQVERTPDAVAVVFEDHQLTYRELNERANQLAYNLRTLGVGPEVLVGICVERSLEMIVGLLGILKAGGAYVPLDPEYPRERLRWMIADANPQVLLTQRQLRPLCLEFNIEANSGSDPVKMPKVVCLDEPLPAAQSSAHESTGEADQLAYVMYTSGSTGQPKGVEVVHRGVLRLVKNTNYASFGADEVFLHMAPPAFDASTFEIWGALLNGGKLVIMPQGKATLEDIGRVISGKGVTTLWLTAGLFHLMADERLDELRPLRQLLAGGDVLSPKPVKRVVSELKGCRMINGYGPTESTTFACCYEAGSEFMGNSVPIGRPIANTSIYILDANLEPVPVGAVGELHVGGDGLARGYLNQPDLTAEKFIPNPFSKAPGARLYKTGDLCRYRSDGNIEFIGRKDHQVKIRGFRIELGEIESVLGSFPNIGGVVVQVQEKVGEKQLVAYLVAKGETKPVISELREFLKKKLPDYMVPAAFVFVSAFPMMPNGKVDRKSLPDVSCNNTVASSAILIPETLTQLKLTHIWRRVLGIENVRDNDTFFDLGGHSLLAVRLVNEVNVSLQSSLSIPELFQNPTIPELARIVDSHIERKPRLVPLKIGNSNGSIFFLDASMGMCRLADLLGDGLNSFATVYPLPAEMLNAAVRNDVRRLPTVEQLALVHANLIRSQPDSGRCVLVGHSFGGLLASEVGRQLIANGRRVDMIVLLDSWAVELPWWKKLKVLSVRRFWRSIVFRGGVLRTRFRRKLVNTMRDDANLEALNDPNRPIGDVPWEVFETICRNAWRTYRLRPLDAKAILFRSADSSEAHLYEIDGKLGWEGLFLGGLSVEDVPGDHFSILKAPNLSVLGRRLDALVQPVAQRQPGIHRKEFPPDLHSNLS